MIFIHIHTGKRGLFLKAKGYSPPWMMHLKFPMEIWALGLTFAHCKLISRLNKKTNL